jgi:hypothetical protein
LVVPPPVILVHILILFPDHDQPFKPQPQASVPPGFTTLMGVLLSIGTLGTLCAASPLAYLNSTIGWRNTFLIAGGINILLGFLIFWILKR